VELRNQTQLKTGSYFFADPKLKSKQRLSLHDIKRGVTYGLIAGLVVGVLGWLFSGEAVWLFSVLAGALLGFGLVVLIHKSEAPVLW
jgi:hypothetical protein